MILYSTWWWSSENLHQQRQDKVVLGLAACPLAVRPISINIKGGEGVTHLIKYAIRKCKLELRCVWTVTCYQRTTTRAVDWRNTGRYGSWPPPSARMPHRSDHRWWRHCQGRLVGKGSQEKSRQESEKTSTPNVEQISRPNTEIYR